MPNGIGDTQAQASAHTPEGRASLAGAGVGDADLCYQSHAHEAAREECRRRYMDGLAGGGMQYIPVPLPHWR